MNRTTVVGWLFALAFVLILSACASAPAERESVVVLATRQAEQALLAGVKQYEDGNYVAAERQLKSALDGKLTFPKDKVVAYKYLAFIYCGSNRTNECAAAFKQALTVDAKFQLSPSESGHPIWGPIFRSAQAQAGGR